MMSHQDQLATDFMTKLATRIALYQRSQAEYNELWLTAMDGAFDKCYKEIYGHFPHGG